MNEKLQRFWRVLAHVCKFANSTFERKHSKVSNQEGWAVRLEGDSIDVGDIMDRLPAPFDPWSEEYADSAGVGLVLRSKAWEKLTTPRDVQMDADRILERLHGEALLYDPDAKRVLPSQVFMFGSDGSRHTFIIVHTATMNIIGGRARMRGKAMRNSASQVPPESETQRWFQDAEGDDDRSELFSHISKCDGWFDIYKIIELAERITKGQKLLKNTLGPDWKEWDRVRQTANCYRHAPNRVKFPLPQRPVELDDARLFVLKVIRNLI